MRRNDIDRITLDTLKRIADALETLVQQRDAGALASLPQSLPVSAHPDGWFMHTSELGTRPVAGDICVDVRFRGGREDLRGVMAAAWWWGADQAYPQNEIVAWRLHR